MNIKVVIGLAVLGLTFAFSSTSHAQFRIDVKGNVSYNLESFKSQARAWTTYSGVDVRVDWIAVYMEHPKCPDYSVQKQERQNSSVVEANLAYSTTGIVCNSPVRIWACALDKAKTDGEKICSNVFTIEAIAQ